MGNAPTLFIKPPYQKTQSYYFQKVLIFSFLLLALVLRLNASMSEKTMPTKDAADYDHLAVNLVEGKGYCVNPDDPTARRPPLYPVFLACIYWIFGHDYTMVRIIQACISLITVIIIVRWAALLFGEISACWAAMIAAVYPPFYSYSYSCQFLVSETLYTFLLTAFLWNLFRYLSKPSYWTGIVAGIALGLAILTRPIPQLLLVFLPLFLIVLRYPWSLVLRFQFLLCAIVLSVLLPWTIRNYMIFKAFVPVSTLTGETFWLTNHPGSDGIGSSAGGTEPWYRDVFYPQSKKLDALGKSEAEKSRFFFSQGLEFVRNHPWEAFRLAIRKGLLFNDPRTVLENDSKRVRIVNYGYLIVAFSTILSYVVGRNTTAIRQSLLLMALLYGYFMLFHMVFPSLDRMRFPLEPMLIVVSSYFFGELCYKIFRKSTS